YERIGRTLDLLRQGLTPFLQRELQSIVGDKWRDRVVELFPGDADVAKSVAGKDPWDCHIVLVTMWQMWNDVFKKTLGHAERSLVSELRTFRNDWAHQKQFTTDDAYRCMDSAERLLSAVSAPQAEKIGNEKAKLMREKYQQDVRNGRKKGMLPGLDGEPMGGLTPWREVITPHDDVASGKFQQAEFAADLWQVYRGEAKAEYGDPVHFFRRTYMTDGLKILLGSALNRLCGDSGDPIVELQTSFGGGKTHSMLALYHLFSGTPFAQMVGVEELTAEAKVKSKSQAVRRAVLVGTRIAPGQPSKKEDGTVINTLWGELAWQLGGKEGYKIVAEADRTSSGPGEALHTLLKKYTPCMILIDEWVAYARQLHDEGILCGGSFETQFTFAQTLTETVRNVEHAMLVLSIPASSDSVSPHMDTQTTDIEVGGERGFQALHRLKNVIGRIESAWRPASQEESYAIVRRRLFDDITDAKLFKSRDAVIDAFMDMYGKQTQEFPTECREAEYRRRMQACYPIHPELFDRLYNEWSSLERFQRTRGVLRLMASVIHSLWDSQDASLMILPASIPIHAQKVQPELTRYLENSWIPVIERDVDGANSLSRRLDHENPNMGRYSACRRVARTIYMASAPTAKTPHKGADDQHVKLGCVQPGESVATFGDALRRLSDQAMHLYTDKNRFWFDTQPTVQRLAKDRANDMKPDLVIDEIQRRLQEEQRSTSGFVKVHASPASSADVADERCVRLVILGPETAHTRNKEDSPAMQAANDLLENRGNSPRQYRNTLLFLAADARLMQPLDEAVRLYLAWESINDDRGEDRLDLSAGQARQVANRLKQSTETVDQRMHEVFCWLLAPGMSDPKGKDVEWQSIRLSGQEPLAERAWKRLSREQAVYQEMGGVVLRMEMDRIPLWPDSHVELRALADYFAKYLYLPRLRDDSVLEGAASEGVGLLTWESDTFAYADAWDEKTKRYLGLRAGVPISIHCDVGGLLVKPDVAATQKREEEAKAGVTDQEEGAVAGTESGGVGVTDIDEDTDMGTGKAPQAQPKRFFGSVKVDATRISRDAGKVADEVVQHLTKQLISDVEVRIEISANAPGGYPEDVVRTVTENCRTLKFETSGFEDE
ncbi:MAG: Swt1 family HEPN domain-containing protein, partial [Verrucomicrobiota bacterium]